MHSLSDLPVMVRKRAEFLNIYCKMAGTYRALDHRQSGCKHSKGIHAFLGWTVFDAAGYGDHEPSFINGKFQSWLSPLDPFQLMQGSAKCIIRSFPEDIKLAKIVENKDILKIYTLESLFLGSSTV